MTSSTFMPVCVSRSTRLFTFSSVQSLSTIWIDPAIGSRIAGDAMTFPFARSAAFLPTLAPVKSICYFADSDLVNVNLIIGLPVRVS